jgi:hypothetical protein
MGVEVASQLAQVSRSRSLQTNVDSAAGQFRPALLPVRRWGMTYARGDALLSRDKASNVLCGASTLELAASKTQTRFRPLSLAR